MWLSYLKIASMWRSVRKRGQLELELDDGNQKYVRIRCDLSVYYKCILDWISPVKSLDVSRLLHWPFCRKNKYRSVKHILRMYCNYGALKNVWSLDISTTRAGLPTYTDSVFLTELQKCDNSSELNFHPIYKKHKPVEIVAGEGMVRIYAVWAFKDQLELYLVLRDSIFVWSPKYIINTGWGVYMMISQLSWTELELTAVRSFWMSTTVTLPSFSPGSFHCKDACLR